MVDNPRWIQVKEINTSEPGHYVFADNPLDRTPDYKSLPNGERPTDNIVGSERPRWETGLLEHLLELYPETVFILDIPFSVRELNRRAFKRLSLPGGPYLYANGLRFCKDEYYWIYRGLHGNISSSEAVLAVEDVGAPSRQDDRWFMRSLPIDRNGKVELGLRGNTSPDVDKRGPFWRGEVTVRACGGTKNTLILGTFLRGAIDYINQRIEVGHIPTWKDGLFVDPLLRPSLPRFQ